MSDCKTTALVLMDDHIRWVMVPQTRFQVGDIYYQMLHDIPAMCVCRSPS